MVFRACPERINRFLLFDWAVLRPAQVLIARSLHGQVTADRLADYIFAGLHRPYTGHDLSKALQRNTERHLGCSLGIRSWRHITAAFHRVHRDPDNPGFLKKIWAADSQRAHSTATADRVYGLDIAQLASAPPDTVLAHLRVSHWWHHLLGVGPLLKATRPHPLAPLVPQSSTIQASTPATSDLELMVQTAFGKLQRRIEQLPRDLEPTLARAIAYTSSKSSSAAGPYANPFPTSSPALSPTLPC